jgi:hypothetical protein
MQNVTTLLQQRLDAQVETLVESKLQRVASHFQEQLDARAAVHDLLESRLQEGTARLEEQLDARVESLVHDLLTGLLSNERKAAYKGAAVVIETEELCNASVQMSRVCK